MKALVTTTACWIVDLRDPSVAGEAEEFLEDFSGELPSDRHWRGEVAQSARIRWSKGTHGPFELARNGILALRLEEDTPTIHQQCPRNHAFFAR